MNLSSISISTQSRLFICFRHALYCVLEGSLAALSLYCMRMRRYNGVNFKPVPVPQATPHKCWHGSCRHNRTIKMDGHVLAWLKP